MKRQFTIVVRLLVLLLLIRTCMANEFFPGVNFDSRMEVNKVHSDIYVSYLRGMGEQPLVNRGRNVVERYRFIWLRASHRPVILRLDVMVDGKGIMTVKIAERAAEAVGKLIRNEQRSVEGPELEQLRALFRNTRFFGLPSGEPVVGLDGSRWIMEACIEGRYHAVSRWKPAPGPIFDLGKSFIEMAIGDLLPIF